MERDATQQILQHIKRESNILIALPVKPSTDALAAGMALARFLEKLGKQPYIASHEYQIPAHHDFLPDHHKIQPWLAAPKQFVISVSLEKAKLEELSYDVEGDTLKIFLTPSSGRFSDADVTSPTARPDHSLIITLDAPDLAALGPVFEAHTDFFYSTPIINIDHHNGNAGFGQMNLVALTATSTCEALYNLFVSTHPEFVDAEIATYLLAGIMTKTNGFRSASVTPQALAAVSALLSRGAKKDEVVHHLFQSKSLNALRLWGRALARLQSDFGGTFIWSRVLRIDFEKSSSSEKDLAGILREFLGSLPTARIAAVIYEGNQGYAAEVLAVSSIDLHRVLNELRPTPHDDGVHVFLGAVSAEEADQKLLAAVGRSLQPSS